MNFRTMVSGSRLSFNRIGGLSLLGLLAGLLGIEMVAIGLGLSSFAIVGTGGGARGVAILEGHTEKLLVATWTRVGILKLLKEPFLRGTGVILA